MNVASYKLVSNTIADHTEHVDIRELQDLNRTILANGSPASKNLQTHREEYTYASPNELASYHKSVAIGTNGHSDVDDELATIEDNKCCQVRNGEVDSDEFLTLLRTVSEDSSDDSTTQQRLVRIPNACTTAVAAVVEELTMLPAPISICEFN